MKLDDAKNETIISGAVGKLIHIIFIYILITNELINVSSEAWSTEHTYFFLNLKEAV